MLLAHDVEIALVTTAALLNTSHDGRDKLIDSAALEKFFADHHVSGEIERTDGELEGVRALRERLRTVWIGDVSLAAAGVNAMLADSGASPYLIEHDKWDWHLHFAKPEAPAVQRLMAELAMGLADLIRAGQIDRLSTCRAPGCEAVLVDLSKNRSRMYCDTGNCGNRQHAAAYRARLQRT